MKTDHASRRAGLLSVAATVSLLLALAGCQAPADTASSPTPSSSATPVGPLEPITIPINASIPSAPIYVALEKGYFEDEGLTVSTVPNLSPAQQQQTLVAGTLQFALTSAGSGTNNAALEGNPLVWVASGALVPGPDGANAFLLVTDAAWKSGIRTVKNLKGETVNIFPGKNSPSGYAVTKMAAAAGLVEGEDYQIRDWGNKNDLRAALIAGSVSNGYFTDPDATLVLTQTDAHSIGSSADVIEGIMSTPLIGNRAWVESHEVETLRFLRAYLRGVSDVMDGLENSWKGSDVPAIVAKYANVEPDLMEKVGWSLYHRDGGFTKSNISALKDEMEFFKGLGSIETIVEPKTYIDSSYVTSAYEELKAEGKVK